MDDGSKAAKEKQINALKSVLNYRHYPPIALTKALQRRVFCGGHEGHID
jgi:hypothetical protein